MPKITFDVRRYQPFKADLVARTAMTRTVSLENWPVLFELPARRAKAGSCGRRRTRRMRTRIKRTSQGTDDFECPRDI